MKNSVKIILLLVLFKSLIAISQNDQHKEYTVFKYPNGNISSEGYLVDGKPDGFWRSYYEDGTLKAEGNRRFFMLDSVWNFYFPDGNLSQKIYYRNDLRNGYTINFDYYYDKDSIKIYYKKSKILYLNGSREGLSYFYDKNSNLKYTYNFRNDKKHGRGKEYNQNGVVITLFDYNNSYLINRTLINRTDHTGAKQGKWIEFHPNGNKKIEKHFRDNKLHGKYIIYDLSENIIEERLYENGEIYVPIEEEEEIIELKAEIITEYHPNGSLKFQGAFIDTIPVGIHREFDNKGNVKVSKEYDREGVLIGKGLFDENGLRTGEWKLFDRFYNYFYGKGNFLEGKKHGNWVYYYPDGTVEQTGRYNMDNPEDEWLWYFPNGELRREESYLRGKREGSYVEYNREGGIVLKGEYFDGVRQGEWYYNVGNITKIGSYEIGARDGYWKYIYNDTGNKSFEGNFVNGDPDGAHKYYYSNGTLRLLANYRMGEKHSHWRKYNPDGSLFITHTYERNQLVRVDGRRINQDF